MREVRIVRGDGGGVHGGHVATPRGVCERDKVRMNMIRGDKAWSSPWQYLPQSEKASPHVHALHARNSEVTLLFSVSCLLFLSPATTCHRILVNKTKRPTKASQKH